ncbi:hypothetical protein CVT26_000670 [Gymnopilus dilepis]|uniref:Uncharacterized protein n=1 Tax=Gymnopilus dilepis TaxID=231916 RepID=A0A409WL76_9AGAR|nr:hypothetical protein CVT26_000670 [Gymnopilus dilepis]
MPRGPIFPRRRRRRRGPPAWVNTNVANGGQAPGAAAAGAGGASNSPTGETPVTASQLAAPLARSAVAGSSSRR